MKEKQENPVKVLFCFAGEEQGKMTLSVILAIIGELFEMLPFLAAAMLANEVYAGTATVGGAFKWAGSAAYAAHAFLYFVIGNEIQNQILLQTLC